ncbi:hypothetical protein GW915_09880 [bacterium]|nr:hypothetical protein [bacterium]
MKTLTHILAFLSLLAIVTSCNSYKPRKKVKHLGHETPWDREKIEQNKKYENADKPTEAEMKRWKEEELDCTVVSQEQMKRARASGCHPMDPRQGYGEGMFCCPDQ